MTHWTLKTFMALAVMALLGAPALANNWEVEGTGTVTWVADGDTFRLDVDDHDNYMRVFKEAEKEQARVDRPLKLYSRFKHSEGSFLVRVGNIDTEESVHPDASRNTKAGEQASRYAKDMLTNERVNYVCWDIGYYGRPICSIWTDDWEYGTHMILEGHADYETGFGNHPFWHGVYRRVQAGEYDGE